MGRLNRIEQCLLIELGWVIFFFITFHDLVGKTVMIPHGPLLVFTAMSSCYLLANYNDYLITKVFHIPMQPNGWQQALKQSALTILINIPIFFSILAGFSVFQNVPGSLRVIFLTASAFVLSHFLISFMVSAVSTFTRE